jgi:hypothetical protein
MLCLLYPNINIKGMHLPSIIVSEKLCMIKELLCTWIKNAWHAFHPLWWRKYEIIQLRG